MALISGGKDSFFNIQHCIALGHELVAVANLYPSSDADEIDSYMFQTVGHNIIDFYGECLQVPVYRQAIVGGSKNQELEYLVTQDDEIEDLYILLKTVMEHHDIQGVSCGAILSLYQRTRVENVCGRLGLTSLAYLWQRDQLLLMSEMCSSGLDARLVKVAAIGLTAADLGKSITQMLPKLQKLNLMYEVHICGEGGEFETIVFDSPLFKHKKLEIEELETVTDPRYDVSYLRLKVKLASKEPEESDSVQPPLLDDSFSTLDFGERNKFELSSTSSPILNLSSSVKEVENYLFISNLTLEEQLVLANINNIFIKLHDALRKYGLEFTHIQHVELLLADMSMFNAINKEYSSKFSGCFLPPSRVCIQTSLPSSSPISLSCTVLKQRNERHGIHVRSISYWAPHNIGPYSQSIVDETATYKLASISGQIPLIPSTMELSLPSNPETDSLLCMQHFHRVKELVGVKNIAAAVCFVTKEDIAPIVGSSWELYVSELETGGSRLLIIVQVSGLPKGASVELSGYTFEEIETEMDDDDDQTAVVLKTQPLPEFESIYTRSIGDMSISIFFTNDISKLESISGQVQLFASNELPLLVSAEMQVTPVSNVWTILGQRFKYGGIAKYWST